MKVAQKDSEKLIWDHQMRSPSSNGIAASAALPSRGLPKLLAWLLVFVFLTYTVYTVRILSSSRACVNSEHILSTTHLSSSIKLSNLTATDPLPSSIHNITAVAVPVPAPSRESRETHQPTDLRHIVFGIAASAKLWDQRKEYIKLWYKPNEMRGIVWLDHPPVKSPDDTILPPVKISEDTSRFKYTNKQGHRSAIRISRIVSETLRLGMEGVRWFVMGDDDTVFVTDNLVRVLSKYDHTQYYYIGSLSESHLQNIFFSYGMAYGGGGFAISYPLAVALEKMQDKCIQRYPSLYGSDDRMQACMAELGVPLTKELGFHQFDVYGNLFGLLTAHPLTPLVTLHHLDIVEPIFPNTTRVQSLQRLLAPTKIDSAGIFQQSICYEKSRTWTVSVSWGYAVQIVRGVMSTREMEMPMRTFLNWYRRADYTAYAFNTRPVARNPCQKPYVYYMSEMRHNVTEDRTRSVYDYHVQPRPICKWKMDDPEVIKVVEVYKKPDPLLWDRSPRRNCCRVMESEKEGTMVIEVGVCRKGEVSRV